MASQEFSFDIVSRADMMEVKNAIDQAQKELHNRYDLKGTKIFISGGDHDLAENIVHLVLARAEGSPAGTKGLTLFIVPRLRADGTPNDVTLGTIEHKMGINGSATCVLNFGENDACEGELVGTDEEARLDQHLPKPVDDRRAAAIAMLHQWMEEDANATDDPEEAERLVRIEIFGERHSIGEMAMDYGGRGNDLVLLWTNPESLPAAILNKIDPQIVLALKQSRGEAPTPLSTDDCRLSISSV